MDPPGLLQHRQDKPAAGRGKRAQSRRHPTYAGGSGLALPITQEVSSGQGWRYQHQTVGHLKGRYRRSSPFFTHAFPVPEAFHPSHHYRAVVAQGLKLQIDT